MKGDLYFQKIKTQGYYLIAEAGVNYYEFAEKNSCSPLEAAKMMVQAAAKAGADAIKFQTYKAESLAMKNSPGAWDHDDIPVDTQYELFQLYDKLDFEDYHELARFSAEQGIDFFSTPFDLMAVDALEDCMEVYKISSSDITNYPLITHIAEKNLPIIMSTGASDASEIDEAVSLIRKYNNRSLTLLHCVLEYPTPYEDANLLKIQSLKERYPDTIVGYSDHTKPDAEMDVLSTAYLLGARVIEKHFTLDKTAKGNDHYHSMDPNDIQKLRNKLAFLQTLCGDGNLSCLPTEEYTRDSVRRSAVSTRAISAGEILTEDMITYKRPGSGISPKEMTGLLGHKVKTDIAKDTLIKVEEIE